MSKKITVTKGASKTIKVKNTGKTVKKNKKDVAALKALIAKQRKRGAFISKDINSKKYTWKSGRLTGIDWHDKELRGKISFSSLTALTYLNCERNYLTKLDLSKNKALTYLDCSYNSLTKLNLPKNKALTYLDCYMNQLTKLDLSKNTKLTYLDCSVNNQLTRLDLSKNTKLKELSCRGNLTKLDLSKNTKLKELDCAANHLTKLDLSNNTALKKVECWTNRLTQLDLPNSAALESLDCKKNQLTKLDVSKNTGLKYLYCKNNQLTQLDLSKNKYLWELSVDCDKNVKVIWYEDTSNNTTSVVEPNASDVAALKALIAQQREQGATVSEDINNSKEYIWNYGRLVAIDWTQRELKGSISFSSLTALRSILCDFNSLTELDVSKNTELASLYCHFNSLTKLDLSKNTKLELLGCDSNVTVTGYNGQITRY
ncbi:MAG: hypothetical protein NC489_36850 [Ruminococcus flavefaciens]|nr:hypothetical protein [Ruminococcus flavefaciens]